MITDKMRDDARSLMMTQQNNSYYKSEYWLNLKKLLLPFICLGCHKSAQTLHHIRYTCPGYETATHIIPICIECHHLIHKTLKETFTADVNKAPRTRKTWFKLFHCKLSSAIAKSKWKEHFNAAVPQPTHFEAWNITKENRFTKKVVFTDNEPRCKICRKYCPGNSLVNGVCKLCVPALHT